RPAGNASAIYSRTRASLKALNRSETTLMLLLKNYWGFLSPVGEGTGLCVNQIMRNDSLTIA
ncbi:hypothetical protein, partial [Enterobacter sp. 04-C-12-SI-ECC]